jgi:hypothetical protein
MVASSIRVAAIGRVAGYQPRLEALGNLYVPPPSARCTGCMHHFRGGMSLCVLSAACVARDALRQAFRATEMRSLVN